MVNQNIASQTATKIPRSHKRAVAWIKRLQKSSLCLFAALCDGKTMTTTGYEINADFSVKRASAAIHSLKLKNLPISTNSVLTGSDVGGTTNQAVFYISKDDLHSLKSDPEKIIVCREGNIGEHGERG